MKLSHIKIRTVKSWQGKEPIYIFQASFSGLPYKTTGVKKFYLVLDIRQTSFGVRLELEKPSNLAPTGGMVNAIRKHCRGATISAIQKNDSNGDLWLTLYSQGQTFWLRLAKSRPPELALIDPTNTIIMRWGTKGTFTKKQSADPSYQQVQDSFLSIKESLIEGFLNTLPGNELSASSDLDSQDQASDSLLPKEQRLLQQKLRRKLKLFQKSLEKQQVKLPSAEGIQQLETQAHLLQSFAYMVNPGDFELTLSPEYSGQELPISIALDPEKNLGSNIESYFIKAKKLKKSRAMGLKIIADNQRDIDQLKQDMASLETLCPEQDIRFLENKYKIVSQQSSSNSAPAIVAKPFKEFLSTSGHRILVGKGPRENDELTKSAKANDYWLHTAGTAGSHVIIPASKDIKASIPEDLLRAGAILAIHYSKYKSDLAGEIYVARRSEIKKQKGMPPGLWNVERCKTIFIRYQEDELKSLLNNMIK